MTTTSSAQGPAQSEAQFNAEEWRSKFYCSFGRFVQACAKVETDLNIHVGGLMHEAVLPAALYRPEISDEEKLRWLNDQALQKKSQLEARYAIQRSAALRIALKGKKVSALRAMILELFELCDAPSKDQAEIRRIFKQVEQIFSIRNRLVHSGAHPDLGQGGDWCCCSNLFTAESEEKWCNMRFRRLHLDQMTRDLEVVPQLLYDTIHSTFAAELEQEPGMNTPEMLAHLADTRGPFHFKPSDIKYEYPMRKSS